MKAKQQITKKILACFFCFVMLFACLPLGAVQVSADEQELSDDIVILYTNDVHTYIDGPLSYDAIAAIKDDLKTKYKHVILADAGDHIQGTAYGSMDNGKSIIELMNAAGYDIATLGNHEFDYAMQGCMNAIDWAEFPYISCNFYHEENGVRKDNVLNDFVLFDCGDEKIAFVGITTPETFSKTTPVYFQDENGNYIYGISGGDDGVELQADVQNAIDKAKHAGATKVIALGHLGVDSSSTPWTSEETIAGVSGLDAFIDGHSHTVMEGKNVKDKDGNDVVLTQTGEYFNRIGMMVIDSETGSITTDFIECSGNEDDGYTLTSDLYSGTELISNATVMGVKDNWMQEIDDQLGQKIGSFAVTFDNYDASGNRLVRVQETNSGDFTADALYYLFDNMDLDVDVAVMNGGGIRNTALTGDISYKDCKDMHPFGNVACLQTVTGQQILDMLEWGARNAGTSESGAFLQVSGLVYSINTSIPNTTQTDDMDAWTGAPSEYRVFDVMVYNKNTNSYEALDLNAKYNLAGYNYTLRDLGDGFAMLDDAVNVLDYVMEDYMVLANYVSGFDGGVVKADNSPLLEKYPGLLIDYSETKGSDRIFFTNNLQEIWVGGTKVNDENANDVLGDGTVYYNAATNTLTLNGAEITTAYNAPSRYSTAENNLAGILATKELNLELIGINKITAPDSSRLSAGMIVKNNLNIFGSGSLITSSGTVSSATNEVLNFGICIYGILSVNNVTVEATAKDATASDELSAISRGIFAINGIKIDGDGRLIASGGKAQGYTATSYGIDVMREQDGSAVLVYDGYLEANSGDVIGVTEATSMGMNLVETDLNLFNHKSEVVISAGDASITDTDAEKTSAYSNGLGVFGANAAINAGTLTVSSGKYAGSTIGDAYAVMVSSWKKQDENGNPLMVGGHLTIKCEGTIQNNTGTTVTINAPYGEALYVSESIEISDALTIATPEKGKLSFVDGSEDNFEYWTILKADGSVAQNIVIKPAVADDTNKPTDTTSPETDDNSNMVLWFVLLVVSGGAVIALTVYDRKRKTASR